MESNHKGSSFFLISATTRTTSWPKANEFMRFKHSLHDIYSAPVLSVLSDLFTTRYRRHFDAFLIRTIVDYIRTSECVTSYTFGSSYALACRSPVPVNAFAVMDVVYQSLQLLSVSVTLLCTGLDYFGNIVAPAVFTGCALCDKACHHSDPLHISNTDRVTVSHWLRCWTQLIDSPKDGLRHCQQDPMQRECLHLCTEWLTALLTTENMKLHTTNNNNNNNDDYCATSIKQHKEGEEVMELSIVHTISVVPGRASRKVPLIQTPEPEKIRKRLSITIPLSI